MTKVCDIPKNKTILYTSLILLVLVIGIGGWCWYTHYIKCGTTMS